MKKVGILAFGEKQGGGIYQYTQSIVAAFEKDKSNQYVVFCSEEDTRFDDYKLEIRKLNRPKGNIILKFLRLFLFLFKIRNAFFRKILFTKLERLIFEDIDIFVSPTISMYPHFFLNKKFIFTLHDMQERYYPSFFSKRENITRNFSNKILAQTSHAIICESTYVRDDIVNFLKINPNKIAIIQSPPPQELINYEFDATKFEIIRQKYKLPKKYIFYPAQCWLHKNHIRLVEAFQLVSQEIEDVFLVLTGSQKDNYPNLVKKITELKLEKKVLHLGYIDYQDLPYLYKMSQMLVMPTLFESVSIPIYEAFALSVPVCSSNVVALPEQVGEAALLFDALDKQDIAQKLIHLLNDNNLRKDLARKGFQRVANFNHQNYSKKLSKLIQ